MSRPLTIPQIRAALGVPPNAALHIDNGWNIIGCTRSPVNQFEFESVYGNGLSTLTETEMVSTGRAAFRAPAGAFCVREWRVQP